MKHDEIMYKMASLALEKEAKFGSKIKPGIKNLYAGYINSLKGYPGEGRKIKEHMRFATKKKKKYPFMGNIYDDMLSSDKNELRKLRKRTLAARGATGAAALGGGYGTYRAVRKRPAE